MVRSRGGRCASPLVRILDILKRSQRHLGMLWFGLRTRMDDLEAAVDELTAEVDALRALPGEVNEIAERANRVLARLNQRARREAAGELELEREREEDQEEDDPVSARIKRQRARLSPVREEG